MNRKILTFSIFFVGLKIPTSGYRPRHKFKPTTENVRISTELSNYTQNDPESLSPISPILIPFLVDLLPAYCPYVTFYDRIQMHINEKLTTNTDFREFVEQVEDVRSDKRKITDLMFEPVRHLMSMVLILERLLYETTKECADDHLDRVELIEVIEGIKAVNRKLNSRKEKNEEYQKVLALYRDIKNFPQALISAKRSVVMRIEAEQMDAVNKAQAVVIFLLNDTAVVCTRCRSYRSLGKLKLSSHKYKVRESIALADVKKIFVCDVSSSELDGFGLMLTASSTMKFPYVWFRVSSAGETSLSIVRDRLVTCLLEVKGERAPDDCWKTIGSEEVSKLFFENSTYSRTIRRFSRKAFWLGSAGVGVLINLQTELSNQNVFRQSVKARNRRQANKLLTVPNVRGHRRYSTDSITSTISAPDSDLMIDDIEF